MQPQNGIFWPFCFYVSSKMAIKCIVVRCTFCQSKTLISEILRISYVDSQTWKRSILARGGGRPRPMQVFLVTLLISTSSYLHNFFSELSPILGLTNGSILLPSQAVVSSFTEGQLPLDRTPTVNLVNKKYCQRSLAHLTRILLTKCCVQPHTQVLASQISRDLAFSK